MRPLRERYGDWALVAGAAEGLGEGFTRQLAAAGFNIIMLDRNREASMHLAAQTRDSYRVAVNVLEIDLASPEAASQCLQAALAVNCRLLVYVAAWSKVANFLDLPEEELDAGLAVNNRTLLHLVHGFAKRLSATSQGGGILLVASLAGLIGPKYVATYAATKSFIIRISEALHGEFAPLGIDLMACCAGTISTPAYWRSNPALGKMSPAFMTPEAVARESLQVFGKRTFFIPGWKNRMQYRLLSWMPRSVASGLVNKAMEKMYGGTV